MSYLVICGIILNAIIATALIYALWISIIFPAVEAFSLCRWYSRIFKHHPSIRPEWSWLGCWWHNFHFMGRDFDSTGSKYGTWRGVGNWIVFLERERGEDV
ncbi:hypothetical protein [Pantoea piersonii]|uniref:hypothetical protein n=1 Tax=Pantoea piersonii TaxID=2364647 RepID=UPI00289A1B1A|nr:hypothetical protein [Pantoea piersonii]